MFRLGSPVRFIAIVVFGLILSACSAAKTVPVGEDLSADVENGLVLVSVTHVGQFSEYSMFFREVGSDTFQTLDIGARFTILPPNMTRWDWDIDDRGHKGDVFALRLPLGTYEVFRWRVGSGVATVTPSDEFSIKFEVEPGTTTYIGNFRFLQTSSTGLTVTGADVQHVDEWDRDWGVFSRKYSSSTVGEVRRIAEGSPLETNLGKSGLIDVRLPIVVYVP